VIYKRFVVLQTRFNGKMFKRPGSEDENMCWKNLGCVIGCQEKNLMVFRLESSRYLISPEKQNTFLLFDSVSESTQVV
jgi:uncharacterized protein (DUF362 family)